MCNWETEGSALFYRTAAINIKCGKKKTATSLSQSENEEKILKKRRSEDKEAATKDSNLPKNHRPKTATNTVQSDAFNMKKTHTRDNQ